MEYIYAALIVNETDGEINEDNITSVLEAAGADVEESRVKALIAALDDVDIEEAVDQAAAVPAGGASASAGGAAEAEAEEAETEEAEETEEEEAEEEEEEEDEADGEGLGQLFG